MELIKKYIAPVLFFGSLAFNYNQGKHDRPTVCSSVLRPILHTETMPGKIIAVGIAGTVFGWLVPHLCLDKNQSHIIRA